MAMDKKLALYLSPLILFSSLTFAKIPTESEINQNIFSNDTDLSQSFFFENKDSSKTFVHSCSEFNDAYLKYAPPIEKTSSSNEFNTLKYNLSSCLLIKSINLKDINEKQNGVTDIDVNSLPCKLPANIYHAINDDDIKKRQSAIKDRKTLHDVDVSIKYAGTADGSYNFSDSVNGIYYLSFLGKTTLKDKQDVYILEQGYAIKDATLQDSRYFLLTKNKNGSFSVAKEIHVF
jgi:hypothetical protein